MNPNGTDTSHYQTIRSYSAVVDSGIEWWAHKCSEGIRYKDPTYRPFIKGTDDLDLKYRLSYHWLKPGNNKEQITNLKNSFDRSTGLMIDAEETGISESQTYDFCRMAEDLFQKPAAVYTGAYVAGGAIWKSKRIFNGTRPRVFAAYTNYLKARWHARPYNWDVWQYSSTGIIPGIIERVDLDRVYNFEIFDAVCGIKTVRPEFKLITPNGVEESTVWMIVGRADSKGDPWRGLWNGAVIRVPTNDVEVANTQAAGLIPKTLPDGATHDIHNPLWKSDVELASFPRIG